MLPNCKPGAGLYFAALLLVIFCTPSNCFAQVKTLYTYQDLSHIYYEEKRDSLDKYWTCPSIYDKKATQKKYKELWDERTDFITGAIDKRCYVYEKELSKYLKGIISEIAAANPQLIPKKPLLLIDRSSSVNAYTVGSNIIIVNLGLLAFAHTREDLAFVLAHELSHNILNHVDNAMKQKAEWLTSDEYKESMNAILDSKHERYTKLMKVYEGYTFNRRRHSRYHEHDADSLAIVLLKKSHIAFDPGFILSLDSVDMPYKQPLKQPIQSYFAAYKLPFETWWTQKKAKGLSTRSYNFTDTTGIEDSLKTHPECKERFARTQQFADAGAAFTPVPQTVYEKATRMLIWNMFDDNMLTPCLYRVLLEKDKGNTDQWYDFMMHNVFAGLVYADKQLTRFNAVSVQKKEYISASYYELQNMLEQMPKESMEQYYKAMYSAAFWSSMDKDAVAFRELMKEVIASADEKQKAAASLEFTQDYSTSMYNEFTDHLPKK